MSPLHPVDAVYDELRDARLNVYYYSAKRDFWRRCDFVLELLQGTLGLGVVGTAMAGRPMLAVVAGLVTMSIPLVRKSCRVVERLAQYEESIKGYKVLAYDVSEIRQQIEASRTYGADLQLQFREARKRRRELEESEVDHVADVRLATRCQERVNRELPADQFFVPEV